ncbi:MAG: hypothetical protein AAGU17_13625 [Anaerolineaceae bacterium]|jgi:hypothetical protein
MTRVGSTVSKLHKALPVTLGVGLILAVLVVSGYFKPVLAFDGKPLSVRADFISTDCFTDGDGANDEPGQKDLTKACIESASKNPIHVTWNWDITGLSGQNSADGCALFDTNMNGLANYAVCNSWRGTPPAQLSTYPVLYRCNDTRSDRCAGGAPITITYGSYCKIVSGNSAFPYDDPFSTGDSYPLDTVSECFIDVGDVDFPTYPVNLLDVCSYPSLQPNSDPSDCIITSDTRGNLEVRKNVVPDDFATNWLISVSGPTPFADTLVGDDTTNKRVVAPGLYTIIESPGANTSSEYQSSWVCNNLAVTPPTVISGTGRTITNLNITAASVWDCTFTNEVKVDIAVTKTDAMTSYPWIKRVGEPYKYTLQINRVDGTAGLLANNVSLIDTLDQWQVYQSNPAYTVTKNGSPYTPPQVCTWTDDNTDGRGGVFTCPNLGNLTSTDTLVVSFWVVPVSGVSTQNLIEYGTCTQNPSLQGTTPVDICNIVTVATTSPEVSTANNLDSEPADIGVPLAVDLARFEVSKVGRKGIFLLWETVSEQDVAGFYIYRSGKPEKMNRLITPELIGAIYPGELTGAVYSFKDTSAKPNKTYYYWLEAIDLDGSVDYYGPVSARLNR